MTLQRSIIKRAIKYQILLFVLSGAIQVIAKPVLVDDFQSYNLGSVNTVTAGRWREDISDNLVSITMDSVYTGNRTLQWQGVHASGGNLFTGTLPAETQIGNEQTKTFFFRFRASVGVVSSGDKSMLFGLASGTAYRARLQTFWPGGAAEPQLRIQDGGTFRIIDTPFTAGETAEWLNMWWVVDTAAGTIKSIQWPDGFAIQSSWDIVDSMSQTC